MNSFIPRHPGLVIGTLNGWDRLLLRGTKRFLSCVAGMFRFLFLNGVFLKDFEAYATDLTGRIRQATVQIARDRGQKDPIYLPDNSQRKEDLARDIAQRDHIRQGLICVLSAVEPCIRPQVHCDRGSHRLELQMIPGKCLHYYHYFMHPRFGFMHVRLQTWLPLTMRVCLNGREWLARQLDDAGLGYRREGNCFLDLADYARTQDLMDQQLSLDWPRELDALVPLVNPVHDALFARQPVPYYWSAQQSEWASDLMCRSPGDLARLYPRLIQHGMTSLASGDVLRFLGRRNQAPNGVHPSFLGQVVTDLKSRPEGVRIKHAVNGNSLKMYDKEGSVLRVETTINGPADFKVFRTTESDPDGPMDWRTLRKGVADMHRRAEVSQAANDRYLEAMAVVDQPEPLAELTGPWCRPVTFKGRRSRALNPLADDDVKLLAAVNRGEFLINGLRNGDLRTILFGDPPADRLVKRRQSAAVTRKIRLLRAHGLLKKVTKTHRYMVTASGRKAIAALLSARQADTNKLLAAA